jgi:hypothetical protein
VKLTIKKRVLVVKKLKNPVDSMINSWTSDVCPRCSCRLRTDLRLVWCSNPTCSYVISCQNPQN